MKKRNLVIGLALTLAVGIGTTAYAVTNSTEPVRQRLGIGRTVSMRGYDSAVSVLKNKLGMTDAQIAEARDSGKSLYDIAEEKGMTADEFRSALSQERAKAVDDAVEKGLITKEQGDIMKANMEKNIVSCTGSFGQSRGYGRGRGMMGGGVRGAYCPLNSASVQ